MHSTNNPGAELTGTDCSDGLARCVEGRVETSRLAHLPYPCGGVSEGRAGACVCPWDVASDCVNGCASEGTIVLADREAARRQLCRPPAGEAIARPPLAGEVPPARVCSEPDIRCVDGVVRRCDAPGRPERDHLVCIHGCDPGIAIDHGEAVTGDGAGTILCRREHAERR